MADKKKEKIDPKLQALMEANKPKESK